MNKLNFGGLTATNIRGRETTLVWLENQGVAHLQVNVVQEVLAVNVLGAFKFPEDALARWSGDLVLSEGDLTATTWANIECRSIQASIDYRWKKRKIVFEYDPTIINGESFKAPTFGFAPQRAPANGTLKDTYTFKIGKDPNAKLENVLGWEAVLNDVGGVALRLITVRSSEHASFLKKLLLDVHVPWNNGRAAFPPFDVATSKGTPKISPETLHQIEVVELAGVCLEQQITPLAHYTHDRGPVEAEGDRVSGSTILGRFHNQRATGRPNGETIEVTTIEFKPPHYRSMLLV